MRTVVGSRGDPGFLVQTAVRSAALAVWDAVGVGVLHPALLAWRVEVALRGLTNRGRGFAQTLTARQLGVPAQGMTPGATPWWLLRGLGRELKLGPGIPFVDVGAGEGLAAAVLSSVMGAPGWAVEPVDGLRQGAEAAYRALGLPLHTAARLEDVPLGACQAAYAAWTCLDRETRSGLTRTLLQLPQGARVATVTHPVEGPGFRPVAAWRSLFPWGMADVHLAERW
jgi:hypothetical protein